VPTLSYALLNAGNFAKLAAILRASSFVSILAADRRLILTNGRRVGRAGFAAGRLLSDKRGAKFNRAILCCYCHRSDKICRRLRITEPASIASTGSLP
jgi:hypothetical protein